jgi:small-conductance mechanosensitive channel
MIPNSRLIEVPTTNWTYQNGTRRMHVPFVVAFGSDKEAVRDCVLKAAHGVPFTLHDSKERRTQVWLVGFGPNGLNFELVVWPALEAVKRPNAAHAAYTWAIEDALRASGFEIPYPQQELRLRGLFGEEGQAARDALRLKPTKGPAAPETAPARVNDAAEELVRGKKVDAAEAKAHGLPPPSSTPPPPKNTVT